MKGHYLQPDIHSLIDQYCEVLRQGRVLDIDSYERKLRQNAVRPSKVIDLLSEARIALMFIRRGAKVTMQDRPDLKIDWLGQTLYAEIKRFHPKRQDELDAAAECAAGTEFVRTGDTTLLEGMTAYEQIASVARKKSDQYVADAVNLLVIDSGSDSLESMAQSAVNEFECLMKKDLESRNLRRLNGIMLVTDWGPIVCGEVCNVEFAHTKHPAFKMPPALSCALYGLRTA